MFSFHDELKRFNLCDQWARAPQFHVPKLRASWQQCNLSGSNLAIMWYRLAPLCLERQSESPAHIQEIKEVIASLQETAGF